MTREIPERSVVLELAAYEDRLATYEDPLESVVTMAGAARPRLTVQVPLSTWDALGRPTRIVATYSVRAAE